MYAFMKKALSVVLIIFLLAGAAPAAAAQQPPPEADSAGIAEATPQNDEAGGSAAAESGTPTGDGAEEAPASPTDVEPEASPEPEAFPEFDMSSEPTGDGDVFSSLGLKTNTGGAQQEKRSTLAPYGEQHTLTINELFATSSGGNGSAQIGNLYGHASGHNAVLKNQVPVSGQTFSWFSSSSGGTNAYTNNNDAIVSIEGDFTGNGRKSQIAWLEYYGSYMAMSLKVGDATAMAKSSDGRLELWPLEDFSAPAATYPADYTLHPSFARNDLHIETADLDGDGYDEIITLVPNYSDLGGGSTLLLIYSLIAPSPSVNWKSSSSWKKTEISLNIGYGQTQSLTSAFSVLRSHSLTVGDLDGDGKEDIAVVCNEQQTNASSSALNYAQAELNILYGGAISAGTYTPGRRDTYTYNSGTPASNTLFGAGKLLPAPPSPAEVGITAAGIAEYFSVSAGSVSNLAVLPTRLAVEIADSDGSAGKELLLGYCLLASANANNTAYSNPAAGYRVEQMRWQRGGDTDRLEKIALPYGTLQMLSGDLLPLMLPDNVNEKTAPYFYLMPSSTWHQSATRQYAASPMRLTAARMNGPQSSPTLIVGNNLHTFTSTGYEHKTSFSNGGKTEYFPYLSNTTAILDVRPAVMSGLNSSSVSEPIYGFAIHLANNADTSRTEFVSGNNAPLSNRSEQNATYDGMLLSPWSSTRCSTMCLPDTDMDSPVLKYVGYDYVHTDPTVVAALAAPPYVGDIANYSSSYTNDFETSYSISVGTSTGTTESSSVSLGAYVSAEAEIGCLFASAVVETEAEFRHSWNSELEEMVETSEAISFDANEEDNVLMVTYPMDVFAYEMTYPTNEDGTETAVCDYIVHVPYAPAYNKVSLDEYDKVYQMYPDDLPDIAGEIFNHEVGYPDTYRYKRANYPANESWLSSNAIGLSTSSGSQGIEYTHTSSSTRTTTTTSSVDFKIGGGAKAGISNSEVKATAGAVFGDESTKGKIVTSTESVTCGGKAGGNPFHALSPYNSMSWKLLQFNYYGKQNFPVITYEVNVNKSMLSSPYLPEDYGIDEARTTSTQVAVYWSPSRDDTNPGANSNLEYGVYRKAAGATGEAALLPPANVVYSPLTRLYSIIDTGRTAGTVYDYYIQARSRASGEGGWGVPTPVFQGTTNPDSAHSYSFTTQPLDITLRPGATAQLSAVFAEGAAVPDLEFQWYRESATGWGALSGTGGIYSGVNTSTLTINESNSGRAGTYRLGASFGSGSGSKTVYSDEVTVLYAKFGTTTQLVSDTANLAGATNASVTAKVAPDPQDTDAARVEDGALVQFICTTPNGGTIIKLGAVSGGEATVTFPLADAGLYSVDATYRGDSDFGMSRSAPLHLNKPGGSGSVIRSNLTQTQFTYGDQVVVSARKYDGSSQNGAQTPIAVTVHGFTAGVPDTTPKSGWAGGSGNTVSVDFKDVGKYRIVISEQNGSSPPIYHDVVVKARPLTYTIGNVTRYIPAETPSAADLHIELTSGELYGSDTGYSAADLIVYDKGGNTVILDANTPEGAYYIYVNPEAAFSSTNKYALAVEEGSYTVRTATSLQTITFGVAAGQEEYGAVEAVEPTSLVTGGKVPTGEQVILVAQAKVGYYEFDSWGVTPDSGAVKDGDTLTIGAANQDYAITANFKPGAITFRPAALTLERGEEHAISAILPPGLGGSVSWVMAGNKSPQTKISPSGLLSISESEGANSITLTATATANSAVTGTLTVTINQPAFYLSVQDGGVEYTHLTLDKGEARTFTVAPVPGDRENTTLKVTSRKKSVAKVTAVDATARTFTVTGAAAGLAELDIQLSDTEESVTVPFTVRVLGNDANTVTVRLNKSETALNIGKTVKLVPTYSPSKSPIASVSWTSSNLGIASVSNSGVVTALAPGEATITLSAKAWNAADVIAPVTCKVTVSAAATSVALLDGEGAPLPKTVTLAVAGCANASPVFENTLQLSARLAPSNCTDTPTWSSSNNAVATVDAGGLVSGGSKAGTATITARAGAKKATYKVTVVVPVPDDGITLTDFTGDLPVGKSATLKATVADRSATLKTTNKKVVWSSDDTSIATVSTSGKVTARRPGSTVIRATSQENPAISAQRAVTVTAPLTAMKFTQKTFTVKTGATATLGLTYNSGKGVTGLGSVTLTSSNPSVLAFTGDGVSADGTLTLTNPGTAIPLAAAATLPAGKTTVSVTIKAQTVRADNNKTYTATLILKVTSQDVVAVAGIALSASSAQKAPGLSHAMGGITNFPLAVGASFTPSVTVTPSNASDKNITWSLHVLNSMIGISEDPLDYVDFDAATGKVTARRACDQMTKLVLIGASSNPDADVISIEFQTAVRTTKLAVRPAAGASATLETGQTVQWQAVPTPAQATFPAVKWTSSNPDVVLIESGDVGQSVTVKALKAGSATLKAQALDGSKKTASVKLTVRQPVKDIVITNAPAYDMIPGMGMFMPGSVEVTHGKTLTLKAALNSATEIVTDDNGQNTISTPNPKPSSMAVEWQLLSGQGIVSLNTKTGVVKGVGYGTAMVAAVPKGATGYSDNATVHRLENGQITSDSYLNVIYVSVAVPAKSVKINQKAFSVPGDGRSLTLSATTTPAFSNLTGSNHTLTWSLPAAAGLDFDMAASGMTGTRTEQSGSITYTQADYPYSNQVTLKTAAVQKDTTFKVTVTTASGKKSSVKIKVVQDAAKVNKVQGVSLKKSALWLQPGKSAKLATAITPRKPAPANKNLIWSIEEYTIGGAKISPTSSLSGSVATVDATGKVAAKGQGYAIVTVTTMDGGYKASCTVYCVVKN